MPEYIDPHSVARAYDQAHDVITLAMDKGVLPSDIPAKWANGLGTLRRLQGQPYHRAPPRGLSHGDDNLSEQEARNLKFTFDKLKQRAEYALEKSRQSRDPMKTYTVIYLSEGQRHRGPDYTSKTSANDAVERFRAQGWQAWIESNRPRNTDQSRDPVATVRSRRTKSTEPNIVYYIKFHSAHGKPDAYYGHPASGGTSAKRKGGTRIRFTPKRQEADTFTRRSAAYRTARQILDTSAAWDSYEVFEALETEFT